MSLSDGSGPQGHGQDGQQGDNKREKLSDTFNADEMLLLNQVAPALRPDDSATDENLWMARDALNESFRHQQRSLELQSPDCTPGSFATKKYKEVKTHANMAKNNARFDLDMLIDQHLVYNPAPGIGGPDWMWFEAKLLEKGLYRADIEKRLAQLASEVKKEGYMAPSDLFYRFEFAIPLKKRQAIEQAARKLGIKITLYGGAGAESALRANDNRVRLADLRQNAARFSTMPGNAEMLGVKQKDKAQLDEEKEIHRANMALVRQLDDEYDREQDRIRAEKYKKIDQQQRLARGQKPAAGDTMTKFNLPPSYTSSAPPTFQAPASTPFGGAPIPRPQRPAGSYGAASSFGEVPDTLFPPPLGSVLSLQQTQRMQQQQQEQSVDEEREVDDVKPADELVEDYYLQKVKLRDLEAAEAGVGRQGLTKTQRRNLERRKQKRKMALRESEHEGDDDDRGRQGQGQAKLSSTSDEDVEMTDAQG